MKSPSYNARKRPPKSSYKLMLTTNSVIFLQKFLRLVKENEGGRGEKGKRGEEKRGRGGKRGGKREGLEGEELKSSCKLPTP